jgi:hypothetical protein
VIDMSGRTDDDGLHLRQYRRADGRCFAIYTFYIMPDAETEKEKVSALIGEAQASLADLLRFDELHGDRWYMRLSADGKVYPWEALTTDSTENDETIKGKIARSERPVTDLVLAFVGVMDWKGKQQRVAHMQYFRTGYSTGLVFGRHLKRSFLRRRMRAHGQFLIIGGCRNIWI